MAGAGQLPCGGGDADKDDTNVFGFVLGPGTAVDVGQVHRFEPPGAGVFTAAAGDVTGRGLFFFFAGRQGDWSKWPMNYAD